METLLKVPGLTSVSPFCFHNEQQRPARCDLLVHVAYGWAIATARPDNQGGELAQHLAALARAVCNTYQLDPGRMVLLVGYRYEGGEHYYSTHFKHYRRDFFGEWTFLEPTRERLHAADVETAFQMLANGNEYVSVLRIAHPAVPTLLAKRRGATS